MATMKKDDKAPAAKKGAPAKPVKKARRVNVMQFTRALIAELKKVTWPSRKDLINTTGVVIVFIIVISLLVGLLDLGASSLLQWITSIGR